MMCVGIERSNDLIKFYFDLLEIVMWDNVMFGIDIDNKFFGRSFNCNW